MRKRNNRKTGFTLIELLVVVSIIAVLVSILVPALAQARKQAKAALCMANLHSWGQIWSIYLTDNEGSFSSGVSIGNVATGSAGWARGEWIVALRPQWDTQSEILKCPMATEGLIDPRSAPSNIYYPYFSHGGPFNTYRQGIWRDTVPGEFCSYGMNLWLYDPPPGYRNRNGSPELQGRPLKAHWRTADQKSPYNIPVFLDSMWRGGGPMQYRNRIEAPAFNGQWRGAGREMMHFAIDRHDGKTNVLFLDFSVRPIGIKELWRLKWHKFYDTTLLPRNAWPAWMEDFPD